jgi:hypothetical protein
MTHGTRMTIGNTAVVGVRPVPHLIEGVLKPRDQIRVYQWTALNEQALVDYWNGTIGSGEFQQRLRRLGNSLPLAKTGITPVAGPFLPPTATLAVHCFYVILLHVDRLAFVGEGRIARDHKQPADAAQRGGDLLDHTVGEVFLFGVTAHVGERKHRDRRFVGQC